MTPYLLRRVLQIIPALAGIAVVAFILINLAPGDVALYIAGNNAAPEVVARIRAEFGLDRPLPIRLLAYLGNLLRGNLGFSFLFGQPVMAVVLERVPSSLLLVVTALVIGTAAGLALGIWAAVRPNTVVDHGITVLALAGYSVPVFWLGQVLILIFAVRLGWLPTQGMLSLRESYAGVAKLVNISEHLVLPSLTLAAWHMAVVTRMTRSSLLDVLRQDFVRTARAKGVNEFRVKLVHALRNALIPVLTVVGLNFGLLLGGAVLTETVFAWPGLGRLVMDAVLARDHPLLMGMFLFISFGVMVLNLATDLLYGTLDPRIRYK